MPISANRYQGVLCCLWNRNCFLCIGPHITYFNFWLIISVLSEWKMDLSRDFHYVRLKNHLPWLLGVTACSKPLRLISHSAQCGYAFVLFLGPFPGLITNLTLRGQTSSTCTLKSLSNWQWFIQKSDLFKIFPLPKAVYSQQCDMCLYTYITVM